MTGIYLRFSTINKMDRRAEVHASPRLSECLKVRERPSSELLHTLEETKIFVGLVESGLRKDCIVPNKVSTSTGFIKVVCRS